MILETFETLRDQFDEACLHVAEEREFAGLVLGPLTDLRMEELPPGSAGWWRGMRWTDPLGPSRTESRGDEGRVYAVGLPGLPPSHTSEESDELPVGRGWGEVAYADEFRGPPRVLLVARGVSEVRSPAVRRFAEVVRRELELG